MCEVWSGQIVGIGQRYVTLGISFPCSEPFRYGDTLDGFSLVFCIFEIVLVEVIGTIEDGTIDGEVTLGHLAPSGRTIDVEIFYLAHKLEIPIYFVPVHWQNAPGSTINIWRCIVQDPVDMLQIRLRDKFGRYRG